MLGYRRALYTLSEAPALATSLSNHSSAARSQVHGVGRMRALVRELSNASANALAPAPSTSVQAETSTTIAQPDSATSDDANRCPREEEHVRAVEEEASRYEKDGTLTDIELEDFDMCRSWQVCHYRMILALTNCSRVLLQANQHRFPLIYRVALDIMPAQASAVPCECVFSSSKETDTLRRTNLSPDLMERLQILKHLYLQHRGERLDFSRGRLASEGDLAPVVSVEQIGRMVAEGRVDELDTLIDKSES